MTEPPRPPGDAAGQPGPDQPPPHSAPDPHQAPPAGGYPPAGYPQAGGYHPPAGDYPPPAGYPPAGGYPHAGYAAGPGMPPPGFASADEKTWALVAHFGGAAGMLVIGGVGGWIAPLIALVAKGNLSPTVRAHAVAALNFQLVWSAVGLIGYVLICVLIGALVVPAAALIGIIFGIIAGVKANENGTIYKYPMTMNIVK